MVIHTPKLDIPATSAAIAAHVARSYNIPYKQYEILVADITRILQNSTGVQTVGSAGQMLLELNKEDDVISVNLPSYLNTSRDRDM